MNADKKRNWIFEHDMSMLSKSIGKYLTGYLEFKPEDVEVTPERKERLIPRDKLHCDKCKGEVGLVVPRKDVKENFRQQVKDALRDAPSSISPQFKHFWFTARCSECGADLILMRS